MTEGREYRTLASVALIKNLVHYVNILIAIEIR